MKSLSVIVLFLVTVNTVIAQINSKPGETKIFIRYEKPVGEYRIGEDLVGLTEIKNKEKIAIRVCNNEAFPHALLNTNADPFLIAKKLTNDFAFPPEQIYFLLSKDCVTNEQKEAVEIWLISNNLDFPQGEKIINYTQISLNPIGKGISNRGMSDYKNASEKLLIELQSNVNSFGVVTGYYLLKPSQLLEKRIKEIEVFFEKNNVTKDRYIILLEPWLDEVSTYPKDKEPIYPNVYLLNTSLNMKNQSCFSSLKNENSIEWFLRL